jgi:cobalt-zinc-cadmium efflux system membrane fusion protein
LIEGSVEPGEPIVTTGAVLLRTEILPGSIGAGCCEVE